MTFDTRTKDKTILAKCTLEQTNYPRDCTKDKTVYEPHSTYRNLKLEDCTVYSKRGKRKGKKGKGDTEEPNPFNLWKEEYNYGEDALNHQYRYKWQQPSSTSCSGWDKVYSGNYFAVYNSAYRSKLKPYNNGMLTEPDLLRGLMHEAKLKAYGDANGPKCPGLVWLGEGREALTALAGIARSAVRVVRDHKRELARIKDRWSDTREYGDRIAEAWLAYSFAIKPLIIQADEIAELLGDPGDEATSFTGNANSQERIIESDILKFSYQGRVYYFDRVTEMRWVGVAKLFPEAKKDLNPYGFGAYDLVLTAWELMKASWLIDYFVKIGSYLEAYRPGGASIKYQSNTEIYEAKVSLVPGKTTGVTTRGHKVSLEPGTSTVTTTIITRNTDVDRPALPKFRDEALQVSQVANQVAYLYRNIHKLGKASERKRRRRNRRKNNRSFV